MNIRESQFMRLSTIKKMERLKGVPSIIKVRGISK